MVGVQESLLVLIFSIPQLVMGNEVGLLLKIMMKALYFAF